MHSRPLTIALDVDEVCARLHDEWLLRYNEKYHDDLTSDDIKSWDIQKWVKPECGPNIFSFLRDPGLYRSIKPYDGVAEMVQQLRARGDRVLFVTSCLEGTFDSKLDWLIRHEFLPKGRAGLKDFVPVTDKTLIRADILVDDHTENLRHFRGYRVLILRRHNEAAMLREGSAVFDIAYSDTRDALVDIAHRSLGQRRFNVSAGNTVVITQPVLAIPPIVGRKEAHARA